MNTPRIRRTTRSAQRIRRSVLTAAVASGLFAQASVYAQDAQPPAPTKTTGEVAELGVVTVTATGREENILAVPYNISVVSGDLIEQAVILDSVELLRYVPGVGVLDRGPRGSSIVSGVRIRGINVDSSALGDYAVGAAPTVAAYVDKTPIFANFLLSDIERVEVLRGPQGTLYGSGALSGAVRYILRQPDLEVQGGRVSGSLSSVDHSSGIGGSGSFTFNQPLSSTFAVRVNGTYNDFPGTSDYKNLYVLDGQGVPVAPDGVLADTAQYYQKKDADTVTQAYGRIAMLWQASDTINFTLSYTAQSDNLGGRRATTLGSDGYGVPYKDLEVGSIQLEPSSRHVNLTSLEADFDLGFATLTSSTAHYNHEGDIISENTGRYASAGWLGDYYYNYPRPMAKAVRKFGDEGFTQEFRLVSSGGDKFDYIVGAFYQDQNRLTSQDSFLVGLKTYADALAAKYHYASWVDSDQDFYYRQKEHFTEIAGYGQVTWHATDSLDLTAGMRYFSDKTTINGAQGIPIWVNPSTGNSLYPIEYSEGTQNDSKTLFMGNFSWTFAPDNQFYGTISEGYRRGGTNGTPTTGRFAESLAWRSYQPDTTTNYELGVKGAVGGLTYNANLFYVDWNNPQINTITSNWGFFTVQNIDSASTRGVELELQGSVGSSFTYGLGYTYTDAHLDADAIAADGKYVINYDGASLANAPENIFNGWLSYGMAVGKGLLTLRGDIYYQSDALNILNKDTSLQYYLLPSFTIFNLSATYSQNNWDMTLWLKNAGNETGATGIYTIPYMGTDPAQNYYGNGSKFNISAPRTLGLTVSYSF
jgi:iron complex outermembrane receptor protein